MKKILISTCFLILYIIFSYNICEAEVVKDLPTFDKLVSDLGADAIDRLNNANGDVELYGTTNAAQGYNARYKVTQAGLMEQDSRTYCISAGEGIYGDEGNDFEMHQCMLIGRKGIYLSENGDSGFGFSTSTLHFHSWEELNEDIEFEMDTGGDYDLSKSVESFKKLYYIMKADDNYGTSSAGDYFVTVNTASFFDWIQGINHYTTDRHSQRQYAIWKNINPVLNFLRYNDDWDSNKGIYNNKVSPAGDEKVEELYNLANSNYNEISTSKDYVAIWFFKSAGTNSEDDFYQDIIIGGKLTKPTDTPETKDVTIKKVDEDNGNPISNAGFVLRRATKEDFSDGTLFGASGTSSEGYRYFSGLDFKKYYYRIYEYSAADKYELSTLNVSDGRKVYFGNFTDANGVVWKNKPYFNLTDSDGGKTIILTNKKKTEEPATLVVKKIDESGNAMAGVQFAIAKVENSKYTFWKMLTTGSSGEIRITNITPGNNSRYAVFEYQTLNGYSLDAANITVKYPNSNNYQGTLNTINGKNYEFIDGNGSTFARPLCFDVTITSSGTLTYTVKNKKAIGGFKIKKIDENGSLLSNVWIGIANSNIASVTWDNYQDGRIISSKSTGSSWGNPLTFSNLEIGKTYGVWEYNSNKYYKNEFIKIGTVTIDGDNSKITLNSNASTYVSINYSNGINIVTNYKYIRWL